LILIPPVTKKSAMLKKELDTPYARFNIKEGILEVSYKKGLIITPEVAREIIKTRLSFCDGHAYPCLILDEGILEIQKSARDILSSSEGTSKLTASALVMGTAYGRIVGNFFIKLTRPSIPVKIFNSESQAIEWLKEFKPS